MVLEKLSITITTFIVENSKLSADIYVQEYKYFNLKTGVFKGGCYNPSILAQNSWFFVLFSQMQPYKT